MRTALALILLTAAATSGNDVPPFALRGVQFVDPREGWAVGDSGVIAHTIDRGETWEPQPSGTKATLTGIAMTSLYEGYVVGRQEVTTGGSSGVVLHTENAGHDWREHQATPLPGLNCVQFVTATTGYVGGDATYSFPSALYRTDDGGRTWHPVPGPRVARVTSLALTDADHGLVMTSQGPYQLRQGRIDRLPTLDGRTPAGKACLHTEGGVTLLAADNGGLFRHDQAGWQPHPLHPLAEVNALAHHGTTSVAVGRLGGVVYRSDDNFQTTSTGTLPTPLPLHAVQMISGQEGWAVGELGTILHTADAGRTWQPKRLGGQRASVLIIANTPEQIPTPIVAKLAHLEGYHTVAALTKRADILRCAQALALVAGAAADQADPHVTPWHMANTAPRPDDERLALERLVLTLKIWRPDLVITPKNYLDNRSNAHAARVTKAIQLAADDAAYPSHRELNLAPHAVGKHVTLVPVLESETRIDCREFHDVLGESPDDYCEPAASLMSANAFRHYLLSYTTLLGHDGGLTEGLVIPPGGTARRVVRNPEPNPDWLATRRRWHDTRRRLEAMTDDQQSEILETLKTLPAPVLARAGVDLARTAGHRGRRSLAVELNRLVAEQAPLETATQDALFWLATHAAATDLTGRDPATNGQVVQAGAGNTTGLDEVMVERSQVALDAMTHLVAFGPAVTRDVRLHLAANAARRKLGRDGDALLTLRTLLAADATDLANNPIKQTLAAEARLYAVNPAGEPPVPQLHVTAGTDPAAAKPVSLQSADGVVKNGYNTTVAMTQHDGNLVVTVVAEGFNHFLTSAGQEEERVTIDLDIDRDFESDLRIPLTSFYPTDLDTAYPGVKPVIVKSCDPDSRRMTATITIPLSTLTKHDPSGQVWNLRVTRVKPGVMTAVWPPGGEARQHEGYGQMVFPPRR